MKTKITIMVLMILSVITTGCVTYGIGETVGYIYAVDDGIMWDKVWFKSSLESSQSDCYLIEDAAIKAQLRNVSGDKKVRLHFKRHLITLGFCPEGTTTEDEIISFEVI